MKEHELAERLQKIAMELSNIVGEIDAECLSKLKKLPARSMISTAEMTEVQMMDVVYPIATRLGVSISKMKGPSKERHIVSARDTAIWALHSSGLYSSTMIGKFMGGRDHSTILVAIRRYKRQMNRQASTGIDIDSPV